MNTKPRTVPTHFGPEIGYAVAALTSVPFRAVQESQFEALKARLLESSLKSAKQPGRTIALRRSANEAATLAWGTPYPLLVFPLLFEERSETASHGGSHHGPARPSGRELVAI